MGKVQKSRNHELISGVNRLGRHRSAQKNFRHFTKGAKGKKVEAKAVVVSTNQPRWYSADDTPKPFASRKNNRKPTALRSSITPGTVLVVLAGRFRGKRVVFLKQLESGLLLITGPFKINGVPLRRVNQSYVIATSTKVDVAKVNVANIDDAFFARTEAKKESGEFFNEEKKKSEVSAARKTAQKSVDTAILAAVKKVEYLHHYLNAKFSLTKNDKPHQMKF